MLIDWMSAELFAITALLVGNIAVIITQRARRPW